MVDNIQDDLKGSVFNAHYFLNKNLLFFSLMEISENIFSLKTSSQRTTDIMPLITERISKVENRVFLAV